jgi:hypothetical protein
MNYESIVEDAKIILEDWVKKQKSIDWSDFDAIELIPFPISSRESDFLEYEPPLDEDYKIIWDKTIVGNEPEALYQIAIIKNEKMRYARYVVYTTQPTACGKSYRNPNWHLLKSESLVTATFLKDDLNAFKRIYLDGEDIELRPLFYPDSKIDEFAIQTLKEVCEVLTDHAELKNYEEDLIDDALKLLGGLPDPCIEVYFNIYVSDYCSIAFDTDEVGLSFEGISNSNVSWKIIRGTKIQYDTSETNRLHLELMELVPMVKDAALAGSVEIFS